MKKIGKVKGLDKIKSLGSDLGKGWYGESVRHGLASRGIPTGRKNNSSEKTKTTNIKPLKELSTRGFVVAVIHLAPMGRELYICYTTAHLVYSSWKIIHEAYQKPERLKEEVYGIVRDEAKRGLTSVQAGFIWDKIEHKVPEPLKAEVNESLTNVMSNVSEEEISLVEHALATI